MRSVEAATRREVATATAAKVPWAAGAIKIRLNAAPARDCYSWMRGKLSRTDSSRRRRRTHVSGPSPPRHLRQDSVLRQRCPTCARTAQAFTQPSRSQRRLTLPSSNVKLLNERSAGATPRPHQGWLRQALRQQPRAIAILALTRAWAAVSTSRSASRCRHLV